MTQVGTVLFTGVPQGTKIKIMRRKGVLHEHTAMGGNLQPSFSLDMARYYQLRLSFTRNFMPHHLDETWFEYDFYLKHRVAYIDMKMKGSNWVYDGGLYYRFEKPRRPGRWHSHRISSSQFAKYEENRLSFKELRRLNRIAFHTQ